MEDHVVDEDGLHKDATKPVSTRLREALFQTLHDMCKSTELSFSLLLILWAFDLVSLSLLPLGPTPSMPWVHSDLVQSLWNTLGNAWFAPGLPYDVGLSMSFLSLYAAMVCTAAAPACIFLWLVAGEMGLTEFHPMWMMPLLRLTLRITQHAVWMPMLINLASAFKCDKPGDTSTYWYGSSVECYGPVHSGLMACGAVLLPTTIALGLLTSLCYVEREPDYSGKRNLLAVPHGRVQAFMLAVKSALAIFYVFVVDSASPWAYLLPMLAAGLAWPAVYLLFMPYHNMVLNKLQVACGCVFVSSCACGLLAAGLAPNLDHWDDSSTTDGKGGDYHAGQAGLLSFLLTLPMVAFAGWSLTTMHAHQYTTGKSAKGHELELKHPYAVELRVRMLIVEAIRSGADPRILVSMKRKDDFQAEDAHGHDEAAVDMGMGMEGAVAGYGSPGQMDGYQGQVTMTADGQVVYMSYTEEPPHLAAARAVRDTINGLWADASQSFAGSAMLHLFWAAYQAHVANNAHLEHIMIKEAQSKADWLQIDVRFFAWSRALQIQQRAEAAGANKMNVERRVRFETLSVQSRYAVKSARDAVRSFWAELSTRFPDLIKLQALGVSINAALSRSHVIFAELLELAPHNPTIMRNYADFLLELANDPRKAQELLADAEQIEEDTVKAHALHATREVLFAQQIKDFDLSSDSVGLLTVSADRANLGVVLHANAACCRLLGYSHREMKGKGLSELIPEPIGSVHNAIMARFLQLGETKFLGVSRLTFVLHGGGYMCAVKVHVQPSGSDFRAVLEPVDPPKGEMYCWFLGGQAGWRVTAVCEHAMSLLSIRPSEMAAGSVKMTSYMQPTGLQEMVQGAKTAGTDFSDVVQLHLAPHGHGHGPAHGHEHGQHHKHTGHGDGTFSNSTSSSVHVKVQMQCIALQLMEQPIHMLRFRLATRAEVADAEARHKSAHAKQVRSTAVDALKTMVGGGTKAQPQRISGLTHLDPLVAHRWARLVAGLLGKDAPATPSVDRDEADNGKSWFSPTSPLLGRPVSSLQPLISGRRGHGGHAGTGRPSINIGTVSRRASSQSMPDHGNSTGRGSPGDMSARLISSPSDLDKSYRQLTRPAKATPVQPVVPEVQQAGQERGRGHHHDDEVSRGRGTGTRDPSRQASRAASRSRSRSQSRPRQVHGGPGAAPLDQPTPAGHPHMSDGADAGACPFLKATQQALEPVGDIPQKSAPITVARTLPVSDVPRKIVAGAAAANGGDVPGNGIVASGSSSGRVHVDLSGRLEDHADGQQLTPAAVSIRRQSLQDGVRLLPAAAPSTHSILASPTGRTPVGRGFGDAVGTSKASSNVGRGTGDNNEGDEFEAAAARVPGRLQAGTPTRPAPGTGLTSGVPRMQSNGIGRVISQPGDRPLLLQPLAYGEAHADDDEEEPGSVAPSGVPSMAPSRTSSFRKAGARVAGTATSAGAAPAVAPAPAEYQPRDPLSLPPGPARSAAALVELKLATHAALLEGGLPTHPPQQHQQQRQGVPQQQQSATVSPKPAVQVTSPGASSGPRKMNSITLRLPTDHVDSQSEEDMDSARGDNDHAAGQARSPSAEGGYGPVVPVVSPTGGQGQAVRVWDAAAKSWVLEPSKDGRGTMALSPGKAGRRNSRALAGSSPRKPSAAFLMPEETAPKPPGSVHSKGSGMTGTSATSVTETLRRAVQYRSGQLESSLRMVQWAVLLTFAVTAMLSLTTLALTNNLLAQLKQNLELVHMNGRRAALAQNFYSSVQSWRMAALGLADPVNMTYQKDRNSIYLDEYDDLNQALYMKVDGTLPQELDLYTNGSAVTVYDVVPGQGPVVFSHFNTTSRTLNLANGATEMSTRMRRVLVMNASAISFNHASGDPYWVTANGLGGLRTAMNLSLMLADSRSANQSAAIRSLDTAVLIVAEVISLLAICLAVIPAVLNVARSRRAIFDVFIAVPQPIIRALHANVDHKILSIAKADEEEEDHRDRIDINMPALARRLAGHDDGSPRDDYGDGSGLQDEDSSDNLHRLLQQARAEMYGQQQAAGQSRHRSLSSGRGHGEGRHSARSSEEGEETDAQETDALRGMVPGHAHHGPSHGHSMRRGSAGSVGLTAAMDLAAAIGLPIMSSRRTSMRIEANGSSSANAGGGMNGQPTRRYSRARSDNMKLVGSFLWPVVLYMVYFVAMWAHKTSILATASHMRAELLWSVQANLYARLSAISVRFSMAYCDDTFIRDQLSLATEQLSFMEVLVDGLLYGSAERGLRAGLQVQSQAFSDTWLINACATNSPPGWYYSMAECTAFDSGILSKGLLGGVRRYGNVGRKIIEWRSNAIGDPSCTPAHIEEWGTDRQLMSQLAGKYLPEMFDRIVQMQLGGALDELTSFHDQYQIIVAAVILALGVFWMLVYRPLITKLDKGIKDVRRLLLLFPDEVARSVPAIVAAGQRLLKEGYGPSELEATNALSTAAIAKGKASRKKVLDGDVGVAVD